MPTGRRALLESKPGVSVCAGDDGSLKRGGAHPRPDPFAGWALNRKWGPPELRTHTDARVGADCQVTWIATSQISRTKSV